MLLKISVLVYRKDRWNRLERDGKIQVSSEVDTLSEGYESLKQELDALLSKVDTETRLAETAQTLQLEIPEKTRNLIRLTRDIELASEHYKMLKLFLENLGVDISKQQLTFDRRLLLSSGSVSNIGATSFPDQ